MRYREDKSYKFETPYHRDSSLIAVPLYYTTHNISFRYYNRSRYSYVKSRYKYDAPFVKNNKSSNWLKR